MFRDEANRPDPAPILQGVLASEALYRAGDPRQMYRVETGSLCHGILWPDRRYEVIEFAFPGEIVGLGFLKTHVSLAHALVDTLVSIVAESDIEDELKLDDILEIRRMSAGEREFDYLKECIMLGPKRSPAVRLANYLLTIRAKLEGHEKSGFISDEHCSQEVADLLQMDQDVMAQALLRLQKQGLIAATVGGLTILNRPALERYADAADNPTPSRSGSKLDQFA